MRLTEQQCQQITDDGRQWTGPLNNAMERFGINTQNRVAMFLAQCAHESGGFRHLVENLHYTAAQLVQMWPQRFTAETAAAMAGDEERIAERAYGGRMGNAVEGGGDGYRFRGRGIIQLTGRTNYRLATNALGEDFTGDPDKAREPRWAALIAAWFWSTNGCNELADAGDFEGVTRRINGGLNGLADRQAWLAKVRGILGAQPAAPVEDRSTTYQEEEKPMGAIALPLLSSILPQILTLFSGRAQAKIAQVTGADPVASEQFLRSLIAQVGQVAGVPVVNDASAVQAVAAITAKADPAQIKSLEDHSLDYLDKLAPLLDKIAEQERAAWRQSDDSADRAATRGQRDKVDIGPSLAQWALVIFAITATIVGGVMIIQVYVDPTHKVDGVLIGLLTILVYAAARIAESPFRYRFGGTAESSVVDSGNVIVRDASKQQTGGKQ